jgi:hypothetical protein
MKPHSDDEPVLVGVGGSHINALAFLVETLGKVKGKTYIFRLITMDAFRERKRKVTPKPAAFDPEPSCDLLLKVISALEIPALVTCQGMTDEAEPYTEFRITVTDDEYYDGLTKSISDEKPEQRLIVALGTLFRAIGKAHGVKFQVRAAKL